MHALQAAVERVSQNTALQSTGATVAKSSLLTDASSLGSAPSARALAGLLGRPSTESQLTLLDPSHVMVETENRHRRAYITGCIQLLNRIVAVSLRLLSPPFSGSDGLVFPSDEDWDDTRDVTSSIPHIAKLQSALGGSVHDLVTRHATFTHDDVCATSCALLVSIARLFVRIIRTRLNLVHRTFGALFRTLQGDLGETSCSAEDSSRITGLYKALAFWKHTSNDQKDTPPSKVGPRRNARSAFEREGRWLSTLAVPPELPKLVTSAATLLNLAPSFLSLRYVDDVIPLLLVWYIR
eukprot:CAMPEP_0176465828 /NCGR_PEP_ID=MMETSP0127-20121128/37526_1 /TAXON_ID=938130 /ORGANISM="Platyophrya macrostoma, Strain WH" /LENGTH=295 /DNA_ID=CAMNT_0017858873 /DNA_START=52 /DNA_END=936 /DNA_ORIENTATION=-